MVALVRVPFYFINLLPTSLLYISILLLRSVRTEFYVVLACARYTFGLIARFRV